MLCHFCNVLKINTYDDVKGQQCVRQRTVGCPISNSRSFGLFFKVLTISVLLIWHNLWCNERKVEMKYAILILIFCCLVCSGRGQVQTISLTDCIQMAIQNNPSLLQSELELSRNDIRLRQSKYERLPSLNAGAGHNWSQGRNIDPSSNQYVDINSSFGSQSLSFSLPIFNGFRILHDIRMKANASEAGKLEYESRMNDLKLDVIEAYLQVLMADDVLKQALSQLEVTQEQMRRAEVMNEEGAYAPGDYFDLKGQFNMDQNAIENYKNAYDINRSRLAFLLNIPVDELPRLETVAQPETTVTYVDAVSLFAQARQVIPDIRALDWRMKEAEEGIKVAQSDLWPSLSLGAGLGTNYSSTNERSPINQMQNNLGKTLSLNLQIPIFNKMRVKSQIKQARLDVQSTAYARDIRLNSLRQETSNAVFNLATLGENIINLKAQATAFEESFRIAKVHFENGNSNSYIFLAAKAKLDNARSQLLVKQYEWLMQKYINDYYAGTMDL